jgi:hypothetical protein
MEKYIGTKQLKATPMTLGDYNNMRGWVDKDGDQLAPGYLVEYQDGGKPNLPGYDGYVSWSPQDVFERSYRPLHGLSFGMALEAMKAGKKVARAGWNGKGMFVFLVAGSQFKVNRPPLLGIYPEGTDITYGAHIDIKAVDGSIRPWVASQSDMLADDWAVVE